MDLAAVVTTIQPPTSSMKLLSHALRPQRSPLFVIGDAKGPAAFDLDGADFFDLERQFRLPFTLAALAPVGHYSRKNIGYLLAMAAGAECIYETDDDNAPAEGWTARSRKVAGARRVSSPRWVNAYSYFSEELVWPRGFPLDRIHDSRPTARPEKIVDAPVQQGLANGSPDVDAVWRLVLDRELDFNTGASVVLDAGSWCPFNSQSTWWWPDAYPLLYLPSFCSFRMTDIWRSFVAQRCLWAAGHELVFNGPEVIQERNVHRLMDDFNDEVPGYLNNDKMVDALSSLELANGQAAMLPNIRLCYAELVAQGWIGQEELSLLDAWLNDIRVIGIAT